MPNPDPRLSAYVLLKPGASLGDVKIAFPGFSIEQPGDRGFSLAAPKSLFEQFFHRPIPLRSRGAVPSLALDAPAELPLHVLPPEIQKQIDRIVFTATDFGPGSF